MFDISVVLWQSEVTLEDFISSPFLVGRAAFLVVLPFFLGKSII